MRRAWALKKVPVASLLLENFDLNVFTDPMEIDVALPSKCVCKSCTTKEGNLSGEPMEVEAVVPYKFMDSPHPPKELKLAIDPTDMEATVLFKLVQKLHLSKKVTVITTM